MGLLGAAVVVAPAAAHAQPLNLFYERAAMRAADLRCGLFAPEVSASLAAATAQARGAALRAGASLEALHNLEQAAQAEAARSDCGSPELAGAADRVRRAYAGFSHTNRFAYPGDSAPWRVVRVASRSNRWRLKQDVRFGADRLSFGLAWAEGHDVLIAVARFADGAVPYGAVLRMRDARNTSEPYLERIGGGPTAGLPLEKRLPPRGSLLSFVAEARSQAGQDLLPKDEKTGWAFRFPPEAARRLATLDPREAVMIEFLFSGDVTRLAYIEVGDFAAGQALLRIAVR